MQLKGLIKFFTAALILITLYQLSFTWFVRNHEKKLEDQAKRYVQNSFATPAQKYPGDNAAQRLYSDTLDQVKESRLRRLMDSTKETKVGFGLTYGQAKEKELNLGLDLQGGMAVTLEVGLDGLLRALSNNPKDPNLNKAIDEANKLKANSSADFVSLFADSYKKINPNGRLAALFANSSRNKLKIDATDAQVVSFVRQEAKGAINNTYGVLRKRIDQFGVAQPNINLDENKGIINVELAGIKDPARVRKYLQSTAKLQFWEMYPMEDLQQAITRADKSLEDYLNGIAPSGDTLQKKDSLGTPAPKDSTKTGNDITDFFKKDSGKPGATADKPAGRVTRPLLSLLVDDAGRLPSTIGYIFTKDTGTFNLYLNNPVFKRELPATARFLFGYATDAQGFRIKDKLGIYVIRTIEGSDKARLEGDKVTNAGQDYDPMRPGEPVVKMSMNAAGGKIWAEMTKANKGKPIAISLDDFVYSAPNVNDEITGGESQIAGSFSIEEAQDLANILKSGKLEAPATIVQDQVVGPTLGAAAVKGGSMAFIISFIVIFVLMLVYYNTSGWVANIALILNLLFTVGVLSALHATLTAAGIAALVLTIGMAVDTNVIIFERIKEELTLGKAYSVAVNDGYRRSLAPILDAHVTTMLTAIILFAFGLGPVLGFATTQMIAIVLNLFCGILVSRLITDWYTNKKRHFQYFTSISRRLFKKAHFKFIEYRKVAYVISVIVLIMGVAAVFNGFREGVEFSGGRSYTIRFAQPTNLDQVRDALNKSLGSYPIIKTVGDSRTLDITTDYLIKEPGIKIDSTVENKLFEVLQPFQPKEKLGSKTVLPTISDDLKSGAKWATFWSILIITIYIFIRFRDWRYSLGTIVALLHDVLVTLAVFSFFKNIVPFPLEIDQHFIAAVLTVIGFSMNDTVIVFDRVREYSHKMPTADKGTIINSAINDTLSRTIMTSMTVFLTLLILFIFGGEVTKGFAFAMLIGVVTGTYSSIFVAAPILVDFAKNKPLGQANILPSNDEKHGVKTSSSPKKS